MSWGDEDRSVTRTLPILALLRILLPVSVFFHVEWYKLLLLVRKECFQFLTRGNVLSTDREVRSRLLCLSLNLNTYLNADVVLNIIKHSLQNSSSSKKLFFVAEDKTISYNYQIYFNICVFKRCQKIYVFINMTITAYVGKIVWLKYIYLAQV